jgi:hypothetical protein
MMVSSENLFVGSTKFRIRLCYYVSESGLSQFDSLTGTSKRKIRRKDAMDNNGSLG